MTTAGPDRPAAEDTPAPPRRSFWRRRLVDPIVAQMTQGVTPDRIALTLAIGTGLSLFPFWGFTSLLNLGVGIWLRLNQPILQTLNQLLGPVHVVMIVVYLRLGEWIWQAEPIPFSISMLTRTAREASVGEFLHRFGWAGIHAFTAWLLSLPLLILGLNVILRPVMRRAASTLRRPRRGDDP